MKQEYADKNLWYGFVIKMPWSLEKRQAFEQMALGKVNIYLYMIEIRSLSLTEHEHHLQMDQRP